MSYATVANVKSLFRDFPVNDPAVTDTEIQEFLDDAFASINTKISTLYSMPISGVKSLATLKVIEKFFAAEVVDSILNSYAEADKKPGWGMKGKELLECLVPTKKAGCKQCEPRGKLEDSTYLGTSTQKGRITVRQNTDPTFVKGGDNW